MRPAGRLTQQVRPVTLTRHYTKHAEGSVLVEFGDTKVLCTATVEEGVPRFLKGQGQGWITAEYGMLPRSTHSRNAREGAGRIHPYAGLRCITGRWRHPYRFDYRRVRGAGGCA